MLFLFQQKIIRKLHVALKFQLELTHFNLLELKKKWWTFNFSIPYEIIIFIELLCSDFRLSENILYAQIFEKRLVASGKFEASFFHHGFCIPFLFRKRILRGSILFFISETQYKKNSLDMSKKRNYCILQMMNWIHLAYSRSLNSVPIIIFLTVPQISFEVFFTDLR